ncbi:L,D-transpeptidase [Methylolobus aquaticus]
MFDARIMALSRLALATFATCLLTTAGCASYHPPVPSAAATAHRATALIPDVPDAAELKPGEFYWHPERSPSGPVVVIVSIPEQRAYVYRNGVRIGSSTVSTGKPGHETPTGVFSVLEKDKHHVSSTYAGAPMPYMERLTWDGVALHAGKLPGYPASHGCVRLPLEFSRELYSVTHTGTHVIIADAHSAPEAIVHPGVIAPVDPQADQRIPGRVTTRRTSMWEPDKAPKGPVSMVVSGADQRLYVYRNGVLIGETAIDITDPGQPLGAGIFVALEGTTHEPSPFAPNRAKRRWMAVGLPSETGKLSLRPDLADRVRVPAQFSQRVYDLLEPGASLVITDRSAAPETRTQPGFRILADADDSRSRHLGHASD